jgi:ferredoxin
MLPHLRLHKARATQRALVGRVEPLRINLGNGAKPTTIVYSDGSASAATCLRCPDARCMRYGFTELRLPGFPTFPGDGTPGVCASGALSWTVDGDSGPTIDRSKCFGCGLCVARCPVGAIHIAKDTTAVIVDTDTKHLRAAANARAIAARPQFTRAARYGTLGVERDASVERVADKIADLLRRSGPRFPTLLARNLLLGTGWQASMRRGGDTNVRIDLIAQRAAMLCAVEVELSDAVIDAPRSVLDSLAVLQARYGVKRKSLMGTVFASGLPNQRSEYWQVIADIQKVLSVRVCTVTPTALIMLVWAGKPLLSLPHGTDGRASIRSGLEKSVGRKLEVSAGVAAALETAK